MDKQAFFNQVRQLEEKSTYFGLIIGIADAEKTTYKAAWEKVEAMRKDMGLSPKYTTYHSFQNNRQKFHHAGEMVRIIYPENSDE